MKRMVPPLVIPIFIPQQGCPHQCVFCDQKVITGHQKRLPSLKELEFEAEKYLAYNHSLTSSIIAFYGGNFLGLSEKKINQMLLFAQDLIGKGKIQGIRFSTRPDTIRDDTLKILENFSVTEIEIGVQSMDNQVLKLCRRGHSASDTKRAVELLKERGYKTGLQLMIGLPGQGEMNAFDSAKQAAELLPDFVRIYPTIVLNQSQLASWYQKGEYQPLTLKEAVFQTKRIYLLFHEHEIPVIRMGLQASQDLADKNIVMAGPYHPAFGHLVFSEIFMDAMYDFFKEKSPGSEGVEMIVHPRSISQLRGIYNQNIKKLKNDFTINEIRIIPDSTLPQDGLFINKQWIDVPLRVRGGKNMGC